MGIISKIKLNYYNNLFQIYLKDKKYNDFVNLFQKCSSSDDLTNFYMNYMNAVIDMPESDDIFKKNIVWINSYDLDDTEYINNFINFYLSDDKISINSYTSYLANQKKITNNFQLITFEDFQSYSYYFQHILSKIDNYSTKFINSRAAFFETTEGAMFTHPKMTSCYIYIVKNPNEIFKKLMKSYNNQADSALQTILNLDQKPERIQSEIAIEEMRSDWSTNVSSWTNENVVNTFRGLVIKYEDLINDTYDNLAGIIFHLNEAGLNIKLDYQKIQYFIDNNKPLNQTHETEISSSSKKRLSRVLLKEAKKLGYEF